MVLTKYRICLILFFLFSWQLYGQEEIVSAGSTAELIKSIDQDLKSIPDSLDHYSDTDIQKIVGIIELSEKINYKEGQTKASFLLSDIYYTRQKYDSTIKYLKQGWETGKELNYDKYFNTYYTRIPLFAWQSGEYSEALEYCLEIKNYYEKKKELGNKYSLFNTMGLVYQSLGDFETAINNYKKAIRISALEGDSMFWGIINANLGKLFYEKGNLDGAIFYFEKGLKMEEKYEAYIPAGRSHEMIARIHIESGQLLDAQAFLQTALSYNNKMNDLTGKARTYITFGQLHLALGNTNTAIDYLQKSIQLAKSSGLNEELSRAYSYIAKAYAKNQDYQKAYGAWMDYFDIYKQIYNVERLLNVKKLEHDLKMQTRENALKQVEISQQLKINRLLYTTIVLSSVLALLFLIMFLNARRSRKSLMTKNQEIEQQKEELKILNEKLHLAVNEAEKANQLKSQFLNNISHEIRTPLNGILGLSSFMAEEDLSPKEKQEYYQMIEENGQSLISTIEDLVDMAHISTKQLVINKETFNMSELLNHLYESFNKDYRLNNIRDVSLICEDKCKGTTVVHDKIKIRKILSSLIDNSIKFTSSGIIKFGAQIENEQLELSVSDTGIGIEPENHTIIFEQFRQLDSSYNRVYEGTGLGLTIVKSFVDAMKGEIIMESAPEKGTSFTIRIPL